MKAPAVYMLASQRNGTLYIGVTSDLVRRIWQHREGVVEGFTNQYGVKTLVWYEQHETMDSAITREKALKKWNRDWKLRLIEERNPQWRDLWLEITGQASPPQNDSHPSDTSPRHSRDTSPRHSREGGNLEALIVQSTTNINSASRNEQTGFPPKARGNDGSAAVGFRDTSPQHSGDASPLHSHETSPLHSHETSPRHSRETSPRHSRETSPRHSREGGNPEAPIVQSTTNINSASRNEQTGFPPKARGNDGNTGGGL